jgi:hypothetical protein
MDCLKIPEQKYCYLLVRKAAHDHDFIPAKPEPVFVNLLGSPGIDSKPGGIYSWAP